MRKPLVAVVAGLFLQLALPAPAQAWWELLEELSGPGKFYGWDIQLRLLCVIQTPTSEKRADGKPVTRTEKVFPTAIGVLVAACPVKPGSTRRAAFDVGARFLSADNNPRFANGERISLTTLEPSVSVNLLASHPDWDFVDYRFGAGAYWFSSPEFPSFNGAFLEPVRFEFHPTSKMKQANPWTALIPVLHVGVLLFPGGFETAQFAASPEVPPRISRDWAFSAGVFLDLEGLFK